MEDRKQDRYQKNTKEMAMKEIKLEIMGKEYQVTIKEFGQYEAKIIVEDKEYVVGLKDLGQQIVLDNIKFQKAFTPAGAAPVPPFDPDKAQSTSPAPVQAPSPAPVSSAPVQSAPASSGTGSAQVVAPLPGLILNVMVKVGDKVTAGQKIMIMEAMKMENDIPAGISGTVKVLNVKNGDNISEGDILAVIE